MEEIFKDTFDNKIHLTDKRWDHIVEQHPEVEPYRFRLQEVLRTPDIVKRSKHDMDTYLYYRYYKDIYGGKFLLVVSKTDKKSLLTCYITDRIKEGSIIWKKD